jgi:2-oxoglutarate ferredoxin oxidoreductase subunit beta
MNELVTPEKLNPKDYASDQEVRWCPGCGDYAILKAMQKTLADVGAERHNTVFVSGIGCSSRFPYYMSTYGFHTIHGRAPAVATGVKLANPELDIWVVTGDGDGMSIGGNHLFHALRRDINMQILLFNNEIYGLTKGQFSPTSRLGTRSPTSPGGSVSRAVNPCYFALGCGAGFVARSADTLQKHMPEVLKRARTHIGASFVEILQNCIIYNDDVFGKVTNKKTGPEHTAYVQHGEPIVFGSDRDKGFRIDPAKLEIEIVSIGEDGLDESDLLVHDETNLTLATMLARLDPDHFPTVLGVLYCAPDRQHPAPAPHARPDVAKAADEVRDLVYGGRTWVVE